VSGCKLHPDKTREPVGCRNHWLAGALVSLIVTINAWNAIGVSTRAWTPGSYQP
jgi:hypothetical protein